MLRRFWIVWLVLALGVAGLLAIGGRPDPTGLGRALDGPWRFHAGDNLGWATPATDDRSWDRIMLASRPDVRDSDVGIPGYLDGWRARGHPRLEGYGWYRRQVALPIHGDLVLLGPPAVDDGYEIYWNGRRIGGVGKLTGAPRVSATRPMLMTLPAPDGTRTALLAIRTFMQPGIDRDLQSGGLRTVPVLASRGDGEALYRAQWRRTIAGYVVDAVEPAAMILLAAIAFFGASTLPRPGFARWAACALVLSGCGRLGNAITAWTELLSLPTVLWLNGLVLAPAAKLAWTLCWNQWTDGRSRRYIPFIAVAAWIASIVAELGRIQPLANAGRAVFALLLVAIAARIAHHGKHGLLALAAMLTTSIGLFAADLSTLGVPGIWFPFNIGVSRSQYAYALALLALAYALVAADDVRTARADDD